MNKSTLQIRVTLSEDLFTHLRAKSNQFGITMSSYLRNLLMNDCKNEKYMTQDPKTETISAYNAAKIEEATSKLTIVENLEEYLNKI